MEFIPEIRRTFQRPELDLVLECNGDCHRSYDTKEETKRDQAITRTYCLIRFHNRIQVETLFNSILKSKPRELIKLYHLENAYR